MAAITVDSLRADALRLADKQDNTVGDTGRPNLAEQIEVIRDYHYELYTKLVSGRIIHPEDVYTINATGLANYGLPLEVFSILSVYRVDVAENFPLDFYDSEWLQHASRKGPAKGYRIKNPLSAAKTIEFDPIPQDGVYKVVYVPNPVNLTMGSNSVDYPLGYERFISYGAAIEFLAYDDMTNPGLERAFARIERSIDKHSLSLVKEQQITSKHRHELYTRRKRKRYYTRR